jgi:hypothetical protein
MNRAFVLIESILTQLVFEHSLRIRIKADALEKADNNEARPVPETQDGGDEGSPSVQAGDSEDDETAEPPKPRSDTSSFIGKLNNLITVDLANVSGARDFLLLCEYHHPHRLPRR